MPKGQASVTAKGFSSVMEWFVSKQHVAYEVASDFMQQRAADIREGTASDAVWLLEHPPLYTAGTSASEADLLDAGSFPVYQSGRGGQYTYHGPGQRIAYVMVDLKNRNSDVRAYVRDLESWIIAALAHFGVTGERRQGRVGIWVDRGHGREDKIAAIGVRVRRWVTFHGISINVAPDLSHYQGIVPCGISGHGVTSLADLGVEASMADMDAALKQTFAEVFGITPGKDQDVGKA
ncbi:MAG: lipoyl(octanoyl) transferase LipB [Alphaproteobacteria bacterium]